MKSDFTDITIVLDRSGSMAQCREEAENGVNHFIEEQRKAPGRCLLTLVQFDTEYEFVHRGVAISEVPKFHLVPRGWTALLDAIGKAINETGERLASMKEEDRPGLVVFVIVTDGLENSSKEFSKNQIKAMIEMQQSKFSWKFTFLGANQDAFAEAGGMGISRDASAQYTPTRAYAAFSAASNNVKRMRAASAEGLCASSGYTDEERTAMSE